MISIKEAKYIGAFKLELLFNDNKTNVVDFSFFLQNHSHPQYNKYKKEEHFKKFFVENGNVVWGKNWDMIFPVYDLYKRAVKA
ncbi:MAG: DUF2442 domain-containing protein [Niabella sp.]|nr:DUF2442 domain-containing protein [Niabella sp.]